jgi:predicted transposase YdaD
MFSRRQLAPELPHQYRALLRNQQIKIVYLDELEISATTSIGIELISLIVGSNQEAISKAQQTVAHTRQRIDNASEQRKIVELIETVLVYKLKNLSREEIEAMFTMDDLKETRYFQDVRAEAKLEGIQEGLEKEKTLIVRQLQHKVGDLSPQLEQRVRNLPLEALENLGEALLDFSGSQDLIAWFNSL